MFNLKDIVFIFTKYLPEGKIWESKYDSKIIEKEGKKEGSLLYHFWYIFASIVKNLLVKIEEESSKTSIDSVGKILGLPDKCIPLGSTYREQLVYIEVKKIVLKKNKNREDFIKIGKLLGFEDIDILNGTEYNLYPPYFVPFYNIPKNQNQRDFIIFVRSNKIFEGMGSVPRLDIPFTPRQKTLNFRILECIFNTYKPSNSKVIFIRKQNVN